MSLAPPVEPMLARAVPRLPGPAALPGGTVFEPNYDGFRLLVFAGRRWHGVPAVPQRA
ncbi:hypothetical protein [Streptomyces sp. ISL-1]|uniref:hypothetical protein n=1 Tax=Streptomyces sp. ISL-1 TaxID=2817657 RepID=UPI002035A235|nr:hypothetical protein [Streptomyces sp. ISL-1]